MTTIKNIAFNLINKDKLYSLYRFQGNGKIRSSMKLMTIDEKNNTSSYQTDRHIYFSRNLRHHKYFIHKRLRQDLNRLLISNGLPIISKDTLNDYKMYNDIIKFITINYKEFKCESISLLTTPRLAALLGENYVLQRDKKHTINALPELSDIRKFGGALGITGEWLKLLNDLTLFYTKTDIYYDDILDFIYKVKLNHSFSKKSDTTEFINKKDPTIILNKNIYSPYHKYSIMDDLERIVEKKSYVPTSDFSTYSNQIIKEIIDEYIKYRDYILKSLENKCKQKVYVKK